ncbi:MAG TPA: hypothetical protein VLI90_06730 [Tepidisphaeraceae bacterium]|nr:hypothetical protein [Tepidisphaeraceae bacterium]
MFLEGVIHQLGAFALAMNVQPDDIHVRLTLDDGDAVVVRAFKTVSAFAGSEWGMILGVGKNSEEALVLRESHILLAHFQLAPEGPASIGFGTESKAG